MVVFSQILYLKSGLQPDLVVISPNWFGSSIIGTLFSVDFLISQTRMTGSYQANDFQIMFPHYDAMSVLQLLETMKLCVQVCVNVNYLELMLITVTEIC